METLIAEGHYAEAEKLTRETVDIDRRVLGPENGDTLSSTDTLAQIMYLEGRYAESERVYRQALDVNRRVLGREHPVTTAVMGGLAQTLVAEGRYAEGERLQREALDIDRRVLGPEHPRTLSLLEVMAYYVVKEGRYNDAEKLFREAIQTAVKANQPGALAEAWYNFACGAAIAGHPKEAVEYLGQAIDHGYLNPEGIAADPDLKSLHDDPHFNALVAKARQPAAVKQ